MLNNILLSTLEQIPAHLGHTEPRRNFFTQSMIHKIFMQKYVYMDVFLFTCNYAAARHFTGLSSLCLQQRLSLMSQWCTNSMFTCLFIVKAIVWCLTAIFPVCYKLHQQLIFISLKKKPTFVLYEGKKTYKTCFLRSNFWAWCDASLEPWCWKLLFCNVLRLVPPLACRWECTY